MKEKDQVLIVIVNFLVPIIFIYGLFFLLGFFQDGFFALIYSVVIIVSSLMILSIRISKINISKNKIELVLFVLLSVLIAYVFGVFLFITNFLSI